MSDELKHDWKCISPGDYDFTYECQRCGAVHVENADNPATRRPETGCAAVTIVLSTIGTSPLADAQRIVAAQLRTIQALMQGVEEHTGKEGTTPVLAYIGRLEAMLAEAQKDAERYRWLRECDMHRSDRMLHITQSKYKDGIFKGQKFLSKKSLDAVIDEAMK